MMKGSGRKQRITADRAHRKAVAKTTKNSSGLRIRAFSPNGTIRFDPVFPPLSFHHERSSRLGGSGLGTPWRAEMHGYSRRWSSTLRSGHRDGGPNTLGVIGVGGHCSGRSDQLIGSQAVTAEDHVSSGVAHQTVEAGIPRQLLQLDHRPDERRVVDGRGRHTRVIARRARKHRSDNQDGEVAPGHVQQRYRIAPVPVNGGIEDPAISERCCRQASS